MNGFDISDPEKALQAYARLRSADNLRIEITRRGKPETIQLNLK
jgi:general secretion pathway protein C